MANYDGAAPPCTHAPCWCGGYEEVLDSAAYEVNKDLFEKIKGVNVTFAENGDVIASDGTVIGRIHRL